MKNTKAEWEHKDKKKKNENDDIYEECTFCLSANINKLERAKTND